jgi:integrase
MSETSLKIRAYRKQQLTDTEIRKLKATVKVQRIADGRGLYLRVKPIPVATKTWIFRFSWLGKVREMGLGVYPAVGLALARVLSSAAREKVARGVNPIADGKNTKAAAINAETQTLAYVFKRWWNEYYNPPAKPGSTPRISADTAKKGYRRWELHMLAQLGDRTIAELTLAEVSTRFNTLAGMEHRHEQAEKLLRQFRAMLTWCIGQDIAVNPKLALYTAAQLPTRPPVKNAPAPLEPNDLRDLLQKIDGYRGQHTTATVLKLLPLLFVRGGDLRKMRWAELDFDNKHWVFDPEKTVQGQQIRGFITPLATQSIELIIGMKPLTGHSEYVFPGRGSHTRTLSSNTINKALQTLGYDTRADISGHGFRALARTLGVERLGEEPRVIEYQLTHISGETLGTAYDRVKYLPERSAFMQRWADYLTALKRGDKMPPLGVYFDPAAAVFAGSTQPTANTKSIDDDGIDWANEI